jgi:DNA-binding NarL/FixJ family response regulator
LRLIVVGKDPLSRGGAAALCEAAGASVVALIGPAEAVARGDVGLAVWDPGTEDLSDLRAAAAAGLAIVALVEGAARAMEALSAGALSALPRGVEPPRLQAALAAAAEGLVSVDQSFAALLRRPPPAPGGEALTGREREVLSLLSEGLTNKAIAARLGVSEHTAKFHVNAILAKLGAENRSEAIVLALRAGWISL